MNLEPLPAFGIGDLKCEQQKAQQVEVVTRRDVLMLVGEKVGKVTHAF